jgi:hypothetical protein
MSRLTSPTYKDISPISGQAVVDTLSVSKGMNICEALMS